MKGEEEDRPRSKSSGMNLIHGVEGGLKAMGKDQNSHADDWETEGMLCCVEDLLNLGGVSCM